MIVAPTGQRGSQGSLRVLLLAEEAAGAQILRAIAASQHEVVAVMTSEAGRPDRASAVRDLAQHLGYPCWPAACVTEHAFLERICAANLDLLVNVHSLFRVPGDVLRAPRLGGFNMHPGPLPEYAGLNVVSWALYHGERMHGVTIHRMVPAIDAGPVAYRAAFAIEERDTALTLSVKCVQAGVPLMLRLLETAATDPAAIPALVQDASRRSYYGRGVPQEGRLDWSRTARDVVNFVRACDYLPFRSPWGHAMGWVQGREVAVVKASRTGESCAALPGTVGPVGGGGVRVASVDEWVLVHRVLTDGRLGDANVSLQPGQRFENDAGGRG